MGFGKPSDAFDYLKKKYTEAGTLFEHESCEEKEKEDVAWTILRMAVNVCDSIDTIDRSLGLIYRVR